MKAELIRADLPGFRISLEELPVTVGRGSDVELRLNDPYVSHYHCKIDQIGGTLLVRDLGSKNGTFVNGAYVTESHVMPGDCLTIGKTHFLAQYERHTEAEHE